MIFSFIVACYNTALYLERCIDSIIRQTYKDWEMILINDGSTDSTAEILRQYVIKDKRIKVFSQDNQGLSAARNRGIDEAVGDYLLFLDSDDWYKDENCLQKIAEKCKNGEAEILAFQFNQIMNEKEYYQHNNLQYFPNERLEYTGKEYLSIVLSKETLYEWYPWLYAFNRKFWSDHHIKFDNKVRYYEDVNVIYKIILKAKKISILKEAIYQYYVGREGQITQTSKKSLQGALNICKYNINAVNEMKIEDELKKLLKNNFSHTYFAALILVNYLEKKDQKDIFCFLDSNRHIMENTINNKDLFLMKIIHILGFRITARLLFVRSKWRKMRKHEI